MIATAIHPDKTRSVTYFGRLLGHYAPVRYKRTGARAWRCVSVLGSLGYAPSERMARAWLMEQAI
jgi:hypothetical protein